MVELDQAQRENLSTALVVARAWAVASGNDPTAVAERVAFCAWTESRGYIYANDGRNTSNSPGFTSGTAATLRRSLNLPHDLTGSNGRSTGMYQQTSEDVGGGWGDMAGTMDPAISTARLLARLVITDNPVYAGTLLTPTGTRRVAVTLSDAIAADVLRVQQPLADEAESSNYDATQVAIAREIVAQLSPVTPTTGAGAITLEGLADMSLTPEQTKQLSDYADQIVQKTIQAKINETNVADLLYNGKHYAAGAVAAIRVKSRLDGKLYPLVNPDGDGFVAGIDQKVAQVAADQAKILDLLSKIAAKLGA